MVGLQPQHPALLIAPPPCGWCDAGGPPHKCLGCADRRAATQWHPDNLPLPDPQLTLDLDLVGAAT